MNSHSSTNNNKKRIAELQKKLEEITTKYVLPYHEDKSSSRNDGIHFWRGKPIIPLSDWADIVNFGEVFTKGSLKYQNTKEALQYFPNDYGSGWLIFYRGVEEEFKEETFTWLVQFAELLKFRKHPEFKDLDIEAYVKRLKYKKEHPNWREEEYRRDHPNEEHGPWDSYGFKD